MASELSDPASASDSLPSASPSLDSVVGEKVSGGWSESSSNSKPNTRVALDLLEVEAVAAHATSEHPEPPARWRPPLHKAGKFFLQN